MSANTRATTTEQQPEPEQGRETCDECGGRLRETPGERVCRECGLVVDADRIDHGPEWRAYDDATPRASPTAGLKHHDHGRGSEIGYTPETSGSRYARLRRWHTRSRKGSKRDRNLAVGLNEVLRMASALDLADSITERACLVWRRIHETGATEGRTIEAHAAAAVLVAARQADRPVTADDVGRVARTDEETPDEKGPRRVYSAVRRIGIELGEDTTPPEPAAFVARIVDELGLPRGVRKEATRVCRRWQEAGIHHGREPMGVAGAAVWSVADVTQAAAGEVAGVTPTTIRNTCGNAPGGQTDLADF